MEPHGRTPAPDAPSSAIALAAVAVMSWLGLYGFAWTDYDAEAAPAFAALVHGHLTRFLAAASAPTAARSSSAPRSPSSPGSSAAASSPSTAWSPSPACSPPPPSASGWSPGCAPTDHSRLARGVALGLCVANPLTLRALEIGHPEELLGAVLCVAAVLLAARDRPLWAGLLLGLAIANKQWALLAVGPVLLALPDGPPPPAPADADRRRRRRRSPLHPRPSSSRPARALAGVGRRHRDRRDLPSRAGLLVRSATPAAWSPTPTTRSSPATGRRRPGWPASPTR